jgi:hypothetical protein
MYKQIHILSNKIPRKSSCVAYIKQKVKALLLESIKALKVSQGEKRINKRLRHPGKQCGEYILCVIIIIVAYVKKVLYDINVHYTRKKCLYYGKILKVTYMPCSLIFHYCFH